MHIDLTDSPPPSPKLKRERSIKREPRVRGGVERVIKQEPVVQPSAANAHLRPEAGIAAEVANDTHTSAEQREKKRKAVQDELAEIELEQRDVRLEQKRLRLKKLLAEMEGGEN